MSLYPDIHPGDWVTMFCGDDGCRFNSHTGPVTHVQAIATRPDLTVVTFIDERDVKHQATNSMLRLIERGSAA